MIHFGGVMEDCARVTGILLDKYILEDEYGNMIEAVIRGNAKKKNNILVGDKVKFEKVYDKNVITAVEQRKNCLIRPPVCNIDTLVIVISVADPKPDYILLDKEIILCLARNIEPIICINKIDLENKAEIEYINSVYANLGIKVILTSTKTGDGIDNLKKALIGKVSAFSGNSGVGKSSISKKIMNLDEIVIGDLGDKTKRGKHTTKHVRLYKIEDKTYILDTPGFSSYELYDISYKNLKDYYPDFFEANCEFDDCNHVNESEDVCQVKKNVSLGKIDKLRYERYVYIFQKLKELEDKKYK
jgi:ribosome biogenesis GTPase